MSETLGSGLKIGEAARRTGVSCRTLRYYEQLGLLVPSLERVDGGARRYSEPDLERVARIRELRELMGFDLEEIGAVLRAEDRIVELRAEWHSGVRLERQEAILAEAVEINSRLRHQVRDKITKLTQVLSELDVRADVHRRLARRLQADKGS